MCVPVALLATWLCACDGDTPPPTLEQVYARLDAALERRGEVYRVTIATAPLPQPGATPPSPPDAYSRRATFWADPTGNAARIESIQGPEIDSAPTLISIRTAEGRYTLDGNAQIEVGPPVECPGASVAVAALLDCPSAAFETYVFEPGGSPRATTGHPAIEVARTELAGRKVIEVVARSERQPYRSGPVSEVRTLYLDARTYLPVESRTETNSGPTLVSVFEHRFVPADGLAPDFFDPLSLPRLRPDPALLLDSPRPAFDVYWPGRVVRGLPGSPDLALWNVSRYLPGGAPANEEQVILEYVPANDPFGQRLAVRLTEYSIEAWAGLPEGLHDPSGGCWTSQILHVGADEVVVFRGYRPRDDRPYEEGNCPDGEPDLFLAHAFLEATVIVVQPWDWPEQSQAAIEALVRALHPREP